MLGSTADFTRRLRRWYTVHRRDLPWRLPRLSSGAHTTTRLDPYNVLVSEAMLQQTQVATVIPYFQRFIAQFPAVKDLALADTQQVLRAWQGLGYYSRARNLQRAAQAIVNDFNGKVPSKVEDLLKLPGIGRYTAGAVSSIAFEQRAPILDGNVARVLSRLDAVREDPRRPAVREKLWERAEEILPQKQIGDFNSALMELGAMVCSPRAPQCLICPVRASCQACAQGLQDQIPPPRPGKKTPLHIRWTFCIRRGESYMVQKRPESGRWAGMWQFLTLEELDTEPTAKLLRDRFSLRVTEPVQLGLVEHSLTHRRYRFDVFACECLAECKGEWATLQELNDRPMPRPHLKIKAMLEQT